MTITQPRLSNPAREFLEELTVARLTRELALDYVWIAYVNPARTEIAISSLGSVAVPFIRPHLDLFPALVELVRARALTLVSLSDQQWAFRIAR
jgi:hypothetical protein